ncbi:Ribosomal RNA small subunit methyltransferase D [Meiothermus luteus]|uniref:Ribosomal RNA small subunit methyltransferase D n=1 Tax=Meiothermus luteus TaxID=2026184 RepID=A0A399EZZ9_9DEIN|nr:RsmD family RNA methyltransferase [Meiothermus luteus]RIH89353.1 Ribosomal RNA small subunit methyltransferase D [Meiothermus luteus]RMH53935.1 MAG: methyltransferase [Deinococcota bacterium]
MLRILGGTARGVPLKVPASARPSPVRLRKALFDYLRYRYPNRGRFLDLYAGSGAVGLEAASEGFEVVLVEKDPEAIRCLRENARRARLSVRIEGKPVERYLLEAQQRGLRFTVAFMAPPYPHDLVQDFERLRQASVVEPGGLCILQHPAELALLLGERRVYGHNALTIVEVGE